MGFLKDIRTAKEALSAKQLSKSFGDIHAVSDLSFAVAAGEVLGLLGPNGAGKSTTVRMLVGLEEADQGEVVVFGERPAAASRRGLIGYCSQDVAIYPTRTVAANMTFFARVAGFTKAEAAEAAASTLEALGLASLSQRLGTKLSGGERRRLHLAISLVGRPPLVVLDEPTSGVDIESRELVLAAIRALADEGQAIVYTSHDLHEVERICDRVLVIDQGAAKLLGTVQELVQGAGELVRLEFAELGHLDAATQTFSKYLPRRRGSLGLELAMGKRSAKAAATSSAVATTCEKRGWVLRRFEVIAPSLEAAYLRAVGGK